MFFNAGLAPLGLIRELHTITEQVGPLSGSKTFSVQTGYYYRAKTIHWVKESGTYEEGTYHTSSILVAQ